MTAQGGTLHSAWLRVPPQNRRAICLMCYGIQCTNRMRDIWDSDHIFHRVCAEHEIEHRLTKVNYPCTNGQGERMNRTIKDATVKHYHYDSHEQIRAHL